MGSAARAKPLEEAAPDEAPALVLPPSRPRGRRPGPVVLLAFIAVFAAFVIGGAMLVLVPWRSQSTEDDYLRSGSTPIGRVTVLSLGVGSGVDGQGRLTGAGGKLAKSAEEIDVAFDLNGIGEPVPVTARLVDERTREQADIAPVLVDRDRHMVFTFPRRPSGWEPGRWRATVYVNAFEAAYAEFDVE